MTKVKICGITNLEDALVAVKAGAYALGFNFYSGSSRYIDPKLAREIIDQLPSNVLNVGVFVNVPEPKSVTRLADQAGVRAIQLHGDESPEYCRALKDRFVIKALRISSDFSPESALEYETNAILLDAFATDAFGGTGQAIDWSIARKTRELIPNLFLAGGLTPDNVGNGISIVHPYAVDACSCLESVPGRKDHSLVRAFMKSVKHAC